ncbi:uncharacterized protein LOC112568256 [Pomacea canaliculata]|uniref:uncharacterized protein LOC112568256 n=1 Tax=Pomacea canaliculata TaxID=400727 RepID=UPI000D72739E|nr:uncharacterized protein LOC112568256 [Pomacea canaliculata]
MDSLSQVCFLTLFVMQRPTFAFICGMTNISEILPEREGSFTNITYLLNATERSAFSGSTSILYEVCVNNTLTVQCEFEWTEGSSHPSLEKWGPGDDVVCSYEPRYLDNSMVTWEMKISQLVSRSLSVMQLYLENKTHNSKTKKIIRRIHIAIVYPPQVTSLTVDGQEVNGTHLINDSQKVNISCSFDKGNPPVTFILVDNNGKELVRGSGPLTYSLLVHCEDDWPTVRCEGNGSKQNRSVSFLVMCPPKFTENSIKIVHSIELDNITLQVKADTKEVDNCLLTSVPSEDNVTIKVSCTLTGHPPDLALSFSLSKRISSIHGIWMLTLLNKRGYATTMLNFTEESRRSLIRESEIPAQTPVKEILIGGTCVAVLIVVIAIIGIRAIKKVNENKRGKF